MLQDDWGTYKYVYFISTYLKWWALAILNVIIPAYYTLLPTFLGGSTSTKKWHKKYQKDKKQGFSNQKIEDILVVMFLTLIVMFS